MVDVAGISGRFHSQILVAAGSFVAFLVVHFTIDGRFAITAESLLTPSVGLAVPLGVLFGVPAAVGIVAGFLVAQIVQVGATLLAVSDAASLFILSVAAAIAWQSTESESVDLTSIRNVGRFVSVTVVVSVGAAAVLAWGGELLGLFPFYVSFRDALIRYLAGTALVAPPVLIGRSLLDSDWIAELESPPLPDTEPGRGFVFIPFFWSALSVIGSIGFTIRERIPQMVFADYGVESLYHLVHPDIWGQGGRRVQVAFGAVMVVAWLVTLAGTPLYEQPEETTAQEDESVQTAIDSDGTRPSSSHREDVEVR